MSNISETYLLVEMTGPATPPRRPGEVIVFTLGDQLGAPPAPSMKSVIRTYLSSNRAEEDRELLQDAAPASHFSILTVQHIDT